MKYASRKYIDLIQGATSKWANWDPPSPIAVGDYGLIDKETGEFRAEGNIYNESLQEPFRSKFGFDLKIEALQPQVQEHGDDEFIAKSWGVTTRTFKASAEGDLVGIASVALKVDLKFDNNKRVAVLVLHKPRYTVLPNDERISRLLKNESDILRGKSIVTQVITCAAYMMHLSDTKAENFSITLSATGPAQPGVDVGGTFGFEWASEASSGISRGGGDPKANYKPLYKLQKPRIKFWERMIGHRGEVHDDDMVNNWQDVDPMWDPLDEEGEEDEIYDAEMHGDFGVFNDGYPDNNDDDDW